MPWVAELNLLIETMTIEDGKKKTFGLETKDFPHRTLTDQKKT